MLYFFFNVGPPKEDIFSDHLLWSIFQFNCYTCYKFPSGPLRVALCTHQWALIDLWSELYFYFLRLQMLNIKWMNEWYMPALIVRSCQNKGFNIWNTPNANWLQNSMRREYCRNGRGWHVFSVLQSHSFVVKGICKNISSLCSVSGTFLNIISGSSYLKRLGSTTLKYCLHEPWLCKFKNWCHGRFSFVFEELDVLH